MKKSGLNKLNPKKDEPNKVLSTVGGASIGALGSLTGLLGSDPQRSTVPAYQYGKKNEAFGKAYGITSAPGSFVAKTYKKVLRKR